MNEIRDLIRAEIHSTADEIRRLKRWWRAAPDDRPEPPVTRFALHPSKRRATLLCMLMAHSRGRIHLRSTGGIDEQAAQLLEVLDAMEPMKLQTPLLDARLREAGRAILARRKQTIVVPPDACVAPTVERRA
jgi:hypothetical protein